MTYDEAFAIIEREGMYSRSNGLRKKRVIVPLTEEYFKLFNSDLMLKHLSKDDVKTYAKDNEFTIWEYSVQLIKGEVFKF